MYFSFVMAWLFSRTVQKSKAHRGVKIVKVSEIDDDLSDVFVQQFIDKPFLVGNRLKCNKK